jgi:hypothetical protein
LLGSRPRSRGWLDIGALTVGLFIYEPLPAALEQESWKVSTQLMIIDGF